MVQLCGSKFFVCWVFLAASLETWKDKGGSLARVGREVSMKGVENKSDGEEVCWAKMR